MLNKVDGVGWHTYVSPGDVWQTFFLGMVDTHFWVWLLNTPLWAHWGWWAHHNEAIFPKWLILWISVTWHSPACQNMSCNYWYVPPGPTIISKSRCAPVYPFISLYQEVRPVCNCVASLGVHIIELCQPSPSTVSTNPEDCVSTKLRTTFDWKACYLSRLSFFFIFNWIKQIY